MATAAIPHIHLLETDDLRVGECVLMLNGKNELCGRLISYIGGKWTESAPRQLHKKLEIVTVPFDEFQERIFSPENFKFHAFAPELLALQADATEDQPDDAAPKPARHKISKAHRALKLISQDDLDDVCSGIDHLALRTCSQFLYPGKAVEIEDIRGARNAKIKAIGVGINGALSILTINEPEFWVDLRKAKITFEDKVSPKRTTVTVNRLQSVVPN